MKSAKKGFDLKRNHLVLILLIAALVLMIWSGVVNYRHRRAEEAHDLARRDVERKAAHCHPLAVALVDVVEGEAGGERRARAHAAARRQRVGDRLARSVEGPRIEERMRHAETLKPGRMSPQRENTAARRRLGAHRKESAPKS